MINIKELFKINWSDILNNTLRLSLCASATLAVTTSAINGIVMGIAVTVVLILSNLVFSLLRNIIPEKIRIPAIITVITGLVSIVQLLIKALFPSIDESLGIYLPLIAVNCIILTRTEKFSFKNGPLFSVLDGLGLGLGFTAILTVIGIIRELLGAGTIFSLPVTAEVIDPMAVFLLPPGGFFVFGIILAIINAVTKKYGIGETSFEKEVGADE